MNIDLAWVVTGLVSMVSAVSVFILKEKNSKLMVLEARVATLETKQAVQELWNQNADEKLDRIIKKLDA